MRPTAAAAAAATTPSPSPRLLLAWALALVAVALISENVRAQDCPASDFLPCAPPGALSPDDAQYRFVGAVSGVTVSELPQGVFDALQLTAADTDTFSRLSFEVQFLRNMASECRITSDWDITSVTASKPQCSLVGSCTSSAESCAGVTPSSTAIDLSIGNVRWSQPLASTTATMAYDTLQYIRKKRYSAANDDAEDNRQSSFCSQENDDLDCQCCNGPDYSDCDDNGNNSSQCPTLCDEDNCDNSTPQSTQDCAPGGKEGVRTYMYAWGHRYTTGATTDYTCSDGNDESDASPCSSSNTILCDRSLHPTTAFGGAAFGALPSDMVNAYALGLVFDGCDFSGTSVCRFNDEVSNWSKLPESISDDVNSGGACVAGADFLQHIDLDALQSYGVHPIRTATYREMVNDVNGNTGGVYTKIDNPGWDYVTSLTCGYCEPDGSSSNLSATRYFQYSMTPTCSLHQITDYSAIIPVWDASFTVTAGSLTETVVPLSQQIGTSQIIDLSSADHTVAVEITLEEALVLTPPSVGATTKDYVVSCIPEGLPDPAPLTSDVDYNFPYLDGTRFPDGPCLGCTPLQQAGLEAQRLWYLISYGTYAGMTGLCLSASSSPSTSYMSGGLNNINGQSHNKPITNPKNIGEYATCAEASQRMCRPLNRFEDNVAGNVAYGPGFTAAPAYGASQFELFHDDYSAWVAAGSVFADEPQWTDYDAHFFMPDFYTPNQSGVPSAWLYLGDKYPGPGLMFVAPDDEDDTDVKPSFRVDLYIRQTVASAGAEYIPATLNMQSSSLSNLCPALNPRDVCDADALSQSSAVDTGFLLEACGYTVVSIGFTIDSASATATVRLNLQACEAQGYIPFCLADNENCQDITGVNGVVITSAAQTRYSNIELFFDANAAATCNSPCEGVVEQCLSPNLSGPSPCTDEEWHPITDTSRVESCADSSGSVLGPPPDEGDFQGAVFCARSVSSTPSFTPTATVTPSQTPSVGADPSSTATRTPALSSPSPTRSRTPSVSSVITVTGTATAYYEPYYYIGDPDACGWFCDLKCLCDGDLLQAQCLLAPCLLLAYLGFIVGFISILACIFCCVRQRKKKKAEDDNALPPME